MASLRFRGRAARLAAALCLTAAPGGWASEHDGCAAVNNTSNNRLTLFEIVEATGQLKSVQEVPTGGLGADGGYYALPQIAATRAMAGQACVFTANAVTNDVTAFRLTIPDTAHGPGCQCEAAGPPVPIGSEAVFGKRGGGVALHPSGAALYTANPGSQDLSTFLVGADCELRPTRWGRAAAPGPPADIEVKPDGRCVAVSSPETDSVTLYAVGAGFRLVAIGDFDVPGPGVATGVEFSSAIRADTLYVTKAHPTQTVVVRFHVGQGCKLEPEPVVTTAHGGWTSNLAELDPEERCLYVPNQRSATVSLLFANHPPSRLTTFSVDAQTGDLTLVGTVDDVAVLPAGMGFADGPGGQRHLYTTSFGRQVLRRPVSGCVPGPVVEPPASTGVPGTGLLGGLAIVQ